MPTLIMPGRPPPAPVIIGAGVSHFADRSLGGLHGGSIGVLEHLIKAAGGLQIAVTTFFQPQQPTLLNRVPFFKRQGNMRCISESFVHPAGLTDLDIHIAAKGVYHQMRSQRGATPQTFGRICGVTVRIKFLVFAPGCFQQPLGVEQQFHCQVLLF